MKKVKHAAAVQHDREPDCPECGAYVCEHLKLKIEEVCRLVEVLKQSELEAVLFKGRFKWVKLDCGFWRVDHI